MESEFAGLVKFLRDIKEMMSEQWKKEEDRIKVLQQVHDEIAKAYGFKSCEVQVQDLGKRTKGTHIGGKIVLNKYLVEDANLETPLKTLAHESRHAYQHHVSSLSVDSLPIERRGEIEAWKENLKHYKQANVVGFEAYFKQSVEVDAREFAEQLIREMYTEGK